MTLQVDVSDGSVAPRITDTSQVSLRRQLVSSSSASMVVASAPELHGIDC